MAPSNSLSSDDELITSVADVSIVATVDTRDAAEITSHAVADDDGDISSSGRNNAAADHLEDAADATPLCELSPSMAAMIQGMSPSFWTNDFEKDWAQLTDDEFTELMLCDDSFDEGRAPTALADSFLLVMGADLI